MTPPATAASDVLHARVRAAIASSKDRGIADGVFDALACDIARFQASCSAGVDRLLNARGVDPSSLRHASQIPAVPTDAFKLRRIACHGSLLDEVVFLTSGTTVGTRGSHALRTTETYRAAARAWGRHMLLPDASSSHWVLLAEDYALASSSSLGFMLADFASEYGSQATWILGGGELDVDSLRRAVARAVDDQAPVVIAGASFAFVHLLDRLDGAVIALPEGSLVMQTGGFKGRAREVDAATLRIGIAGAFEVGAEYVVGEYGMTELSSQAYEGCLRRALSLGPPAGPAGVYFAPPWMRVIAVDPVSLEPLESGQVGIARIEDLANVDSAVAVQTADRIRTVEGGFELLGRDPSATPRGCSLGVDEILGEG